MNTKNYLQMLRDIKDVAFATVDEEGRPQVRIIDVMLVTDDSLIFCTARGKDFYHQLLRNNQVAITGMNKEWQMLRLNGIARRLDNQEFWLERIFTANPSMNDVYPGDSRFILDAFCINEGTLELFDLGKTPVFRTTVTLGNAFSAPKGFLIGDACIHCGQCANACPQQCITPGKPYSIQQEHCLRCGRCAEICPIQAVTKRIDTYGL